jgi:hypothetical protein
MSRQAASSQEGSGGDYDDYLGIDQEVARNPDPEYGRLSRKPTIWGLLPNQASNWG